MNSDRRTVPPTAATGGDTTHIEEMYSMRMSPPQVLFCYSQEACRTFLPAEVVDNSH